MLDRIKYFINLIKNGEYNPVRYIFTNCLELLFNGSDKAKNG